MSRRRLDTSKVRSALRERGWSQEDLARAGGLSISTVNRALCERTRRRSEISDYRIARALGVRLSSLVTDLESPIEKPQHLSVLLEVTADLVRYLGAHPEDLYTLSPRKFETLVAELLHDMGCDVELTPQTRDGGRDVLAAIPARIGRILALVECKRYAAHRKVGISAVERFLFTLNERDRASLGLIATTSSFTAGAETLERDHQYRLFLKGFDHLKEWLANYGRWSVLGSGGLWLPRRDGAGR